MVPIFPKIFANKGILIYFISLAAVSLLFFRYAMGIEFILLGAMWVIGFFLLSSSLTKRWLRTSRREFIGSVFWLALGLRVAWVVFSYFFYTAKTGQPFEFNAADSMGYHEEAMWLADAGWKTAFEYWGSKGGVSDIGYPFWLTALYMAFGPSVIIARLFKCLFSATTCVLVYKLSTRTFGEFGGRMAAIFTVLFPNFIIYCGLHLKETEMVFLSVVFLERADYIIRSRIIRFSTLLLTFSLALSLFFFRTVLGMVALLSFFAGLLFTATTLTKRAKNWLITLFVLASVSIFAGGTIATEVEGYWESRVENQFKKREQQTSRGNLWAKYATGTVLAPMEFIMPLSTMVDTDQENQMVLHGGNYVRNFLGIFVLIALFTILFKYKNWRNFSLIGSFLIGYLGVISFSGFANSERFLLPAAPILLIAAAYGISKLNATNIKFVNYWYFIIVLVEVGWAYFKIGSRGLL